MEFISKIQRRIYTFLTNRQLQKRSRRKMVMGLDEAKQIGIVFNASEAAEYRLVSKFVKTLEDIDKKVVVLGFVSQKKMPGYVNPHLNWDFFQARDFSWNFTPRTTAVTTFMDKKFDILIDLTPASMMYTKYLSALSVASYKVGVFDKEQLNTYDLFLQMPADTSLQQLIDQSVYYLKMIKKPVLHA